MLPAIVLLLLAVGWGLAAGRLLLHGGDVHQALDDSTCLSGDATWAAVQGAIAALGILTMLATTTATARAGTRWRAPRTLAPAVGAVVLAVAWLLLMTALDPRRDLGVYGGACGLA